MVGAIRKRDKFWRVIAWPIQFRRLNVFFFLLWGFHSWKGINLCLFYLFPGTSGKKKGGLKICMLKWFAILNWWNFETLKKICLNFENTSKIINKIKIKLIKNKLRKTIKTKQNISLWHQFQSVKPDFQPLFILDKWPLQLAKLSN